MTSAMLFPGQGAQKEGMLHELPDHPAVRETLTEAADLLAMDVLSLDSEASLCTTTGAQLALFLASVSVARALLAEGLHPVAVAGLSVGAFAAGTVAGAVPFADALRLVRLRGERMQEGFSAGYGMGVIVGLVERKVTELVASIHTQDEPLYVANINSPRQITVAGCERALDRVLASAQSCGARRAERLAVPALSHCPLLEPVADELARTACSIVLHPPSIPYVSNVRARLLRDAPAILDDMIRNIMHGVRWADAMVLLDELGTNLFVSLSPGRILADLVSDAVPAARIVDMDFCPLHYAITLQHSG